MQTKNFIEGVHELSSRDKVFNSIQKELGIVKFESRSLNFISFCKIIIGQQLSSKAAETIFNRFNNFFNKGIDPENVLSLKDHDFRSVGLSRGKERYIRNLSMRLNDDPNFFKEINDLPSDQAYNVLIKIDGVGPWTANIIQLFYLGNLDIFPYGDSSLEKVYSKLYSTSLNTSNPNSYEHLEWASPHRGILAIYLWQYLDSGLYK